MRRVRQQDHGHVLPGDVHHVVGAHRGDLDGLFSVFVVMFGRHLKEEFHGWQSIGGDEFSFLLDSGTIDGPIRAIRRAHDFDPFARKTMKEVFLGPGLPDEIPEEAVLDAGVQDKAVLLVAEIKKTSFAKDMKAV